MNYLLIIVYFRDKINKIILKGPIMAKGGNSRKEKRKPKKDKKV